MSTRNIMRAWRASTAADQAAGRDWYPRAHRLARELFPDDIVRGAAVIAIPSPMTAWALNVRIARDAAALATDGATFDDILAGMEGWPVTPANRRKLAAVLAGADPDLVVSGPKVRPFFRMIADPIAEGSWVVVDRHAVDIYAGRVQSDKQRAAILGKVAGHEDVAAAYRRAAKIVTRETGIPTSASDVQAVTWLYWRRERAQANHGRRDGEL